MQGAFLATYLLSLIKARVLFHLLDSLQVLSHRLRGNGPGKLE